MRRIAVTVKPNAKKTAFIFRDDDAGIYGVAIQSSPQKNKANRELLKFLKKELGKDIRLVAGEKSKKKVIEVG